MKRILRKICASVLSVVMLVLSAPSILYAEEYTTLDANDYEDGTYYAQIETNYFYTTTSSFLTESYIQDYIVQVNIETVENEKQITLILPMDMENYSSATQFGYSFTQHEYNESEWSDLSGNYSDYVDWKSAVSNDSLTELSEYVTTGYVFNVPLTYLTDTVYCYLQQNTIYYEGLSISIASLSEDRVYADYDLPTATLSAVPGNSADYVDGVFHYKTSDIYARLKLSTDGTPDKTVGYYIIDDGNEIYEGTGNSSYIDLRMIGRLAYERLSDTSKKNIDYIDENSDAHTITIKACAKVNYRDSMEDYFTDWYEIEISVGKAGVASINASEYPDIFTYSEAVPQLNIKYKTSIYGIPYDSQLVMSSVDDEDVISNIQTELGIENFEALNIELLDKDGNLQTEFITHSSSYTSWDKTTLKKQFTMPSIGDYDLTSMSVYLYDEETKELTPQSITLYTIYDNTDVKGTFTFQSTATGQPSGIYVFTQADYADYASTVSGWVTAAAYLVDNDNKFVKSAYNGAIVNNRANIYGVDDSLYQYVVLQPIDGSYVENVKYYDGSEYCTAEVVECYENGSPKVVYIPLINNSAYTPLTFTVDDEEQSATLAMNFANLGTLASAPSLTAPVVSATDENGEERTKYVNDAAAAIDMSAYTDSGKIYYSVTSDISGTVAQETEYTEPFTLTASGTDAETYTVTAYVKANSENEYDYASSAVTTKTVSFSAQGAYAETVEEPLIGVQYQSGESLADSVFKVTITDATDGAAIYYTTDGTDPTSESILYTEPFTVNGETDGAATVIKAVAFKEEMNESPTAQKTVEFLTDWWDNILPGTEYTVPVKMVKYGKTDSLSMGNDAIAGDATLYVDADGNKTLTIPFQQIPVGGILGTIIHYWYFPDDTVYYSSDWADNLDYESEYTYNASGMIDSVTFPVYTDEELIPTALESDFSLMGKQRTYIKPDYSEVIYAVTGEVTDNTEVDMPTITAVQSADGSSYEVTLAMESASDYADADIYYLITNDDDTELTEENRIAYTGMLTVDKSAANSDGVVNILAQAVSGENSSMINLKKILFDMTEATPTPTVEPTAEPTEEPTATPTVEQTAEPTEEPTATPEPTEEPTSEPTEEPSSDIDVTEDGYYNVKVQLYKSDVDELSMGNAAFEDAPMAVIKTENGKSTIIVSTTPVEMDYYEDGSALITSALKNMRFTNANGQLQYVTPVLQTATTSVNGDSVVEFDYLEKFSFALPSTTEDYVDVQILVPNTPMGEDYIDARLYIDWSTLAAYDSTVTITSAEKSEGGITAELSSGGADETVTAIAALYDADGALIKMVSQEVTLSETGTTAVEFAADATAAAKTKIFVWDSTAGLVPYAVSYEI